MEVEFPDRGFEMATGSLFDCIGPAMNGLLYLGPAWKGWQW